MAPSPNQNAFFAALQQRSRLPDVATTWRWVGRDEAGLAIIRSDNGTIVRARIAGNAAIGDGDVVLYVPPQPGQGLGQVQLATALPVPFIERREDAVDSCPAYSVDESIFRTNNIGLSFETASKFRGNFAVFGVGTAGDDARQGGGDGNLAYEIPETATLCRAFLYWQTITNTGSETATITIDGEPVEGVKIGQSNAPDWASNAFCKVYRTDFADVLKEKGKTGTLFITGMPSLFSGGTIDDSNGVTLVLLYSDPTAEDEIELQILDGSVRRQTFPDSFVQSPIFFTIPPNCDRIAFASGGNNRLPSEASIPQRVRNDQTFEFFDIPGTPISANAGMMICIHDTQILELEESGIFPPEAAPLPDPPRSFEYSSVDGDSHLFLLIFQIK